MSKSRNTGAGASARRRVTAGRLSSEVDPVTGLSEAQMAALGEQAYAERDDATAWEEEPPAEVSPEARSVVSVRFNRGELRAIEQAAKDVGLPVSTFIRAIALEATTRGDDAGDARGRVAELLRHMESDLAQISRQLRLSA